MFSIFPGSSVVLSPLLGAADKKTLKEAFSPEAYKDLDNAYDEIIGMLVQMQKNPEKWSI